MTPEHHRRSQMNKLQTTLVVKQQQLVKTEAAILEC